ncbi:MAG: RNA polymerase sigma factor [Candidatus Nomurabacteria bacterium]|nr:MAG: RNA polymerase sigma factor [Candidatus Nomurabacteria bacterium]
MQHESQVQEIVARAQQGDQEGVAELFHLFGDRVFRFLLMRVSSQETAEDLTQTVFLEMIRSLPRYKEQKHAKFSTWLFQIARFRLIDHYRGQRTQVDIESVSHTLSSDPDEMPDVIMEREMESALTRLPERYATLLHMLYREDLSISEVAKVMQISALNVRVLKHRALQALRKEMEQLSYS